MSWFRPIVLMAVAGLVHAETHVSNRNLWINYVGDHPLENPRWGVHLETQIRRSDFGGAWQQLLLRPGLNYAINRTVSVSAGYAWVETHPYGDLPLPTEVPENRAWEQALFRQQALGLDWIHRVRLEQRFLGQISVQDGQAVVDGWRYENRFRYLLRTSVPLSGDRRWYLALWDEVFVNFGENVSGNHFDQNRIFLGLGWRINDVTRLETGFLEQTLQRRGGTVWEFNQTLAIWLMSQWPGRQ